VSRPKLTKLFTPDVEKKS